MNVNWGLVFLILRIIIDKVKCIVFFSGDYDMCVFYIGLEVWILFMGYEVID